MECMDLSVTNVLRTLLPMTEFELVSSVERLQLHCNQHLDEQ